MASVRAENLAHVLWELKRLDKLATFTEAATRAGFKPGAAGRTLLTCVASVQRDWPHLQWWRTIPDDGLVADDSPHAKALKEAGIELEAAKGKKGYVAISDLTSRLFSWQQATAEAVA